MGEAGHSPGLERPGSKSSGSMVAASHHGTPTVPQVGSDLLAQIELPAPCKEPDGGGSPHESMKRVEKFDRLDAELAMEAEVDRAVSFALAYQAFPKSEMGLPA